MFPLHDSLTPDIREELKEYDDLVAGLLARRNITTSKEAQAFLSPSYDEHIHDPMRILNMPKVAERIARAIDVQERITVWSDYDCDGIPGAVILHDFLKKAGANFTNYIPHRHLEGYGVNILGLEKLAKEGTKLLVTVDSGIVDVEAITRAQQLGIEVIITDHHLPGKELPPAYAVIDPKQEGETYPFRELCGAGLAWKTVCAVLAHGFTGRENIPEGWEKWLLDMVALATVADMVPLTGENRVLVKYGLVVIKKSPRIGLQKLCKSARVEQRSITEDDIGFMIAPRVNAASRMGDPIDAFRLFTTDSESEADELAKKLESVNRSRKASAGAITRAVHEKIEKRTEPLGSVIALGDPDWRPGLLGLVASGIAEQYERPVFLWGREGSDVLKGSCRGGPGNVHVVDLMNEARSTFVEFGGHSAAGGYSITTDGVFTLEKELCDALARMPQKDDQDMFSRADAEIALSEATHALLSKMERLAPFGMKNDKPMFVFRRVPIASVAWFGKGEEHLRLTLQEEASSSVEAIAFYARRQLGRVCDTLTSGKEATILATLEKDMFTRGRPIRLRLVAINV